MSLRSLLADVERRGKRLVVYGDDDGSIAERFDTRNATVEHRPLPATAPGPFVVVRDTEGFRGAIGLGTLEAFLSPPIRRPWDLEALPSEYRALFELLEDTVFASLSRRQLLATARELEDRAFRVGRGTLRVGFQSPSAFRDQEPVYRWLTANADLDVHVYALPAVSPDDAAHWPATFHDEPADVVGRYWFLVFDGGGNDEHAFALVAEERDEGEYYGFWTADPAIVARAMDAVT